jgi:TPR repeat protein/type II secretory pathway predicted ATPase ExeA
MAFNSATVSDTEGLYLGGRYLEILDFLCSPATGHRNVKVLISKPGLGKTVLLRAAIERIKAEARTAFVFWTLFRAKDFVRHLLVEMGSTESPPRDLNTARRRFENLLGRAAAEGKRFVIAVDDAHNLSPAAFKYLSALLDCDAARPPQLTLLLAGLPRLHDQITDPEARELGERIARVMTIEPLNEEQTAEYISARIAALGVGPVAQEQLANIAASSGGVLRTIDKLCQQLLPQNGSSHQRTNEAFHIETSANKRSITPELPVARIAAWATNNSATWSGTAAELAAATCVPVQEISDVVENRAQELRQAGIGLALQRSPGKLRMITLSQIEPEQAPESHEVIPELDVEDANPPPAQEGQRLETELGLNQEPANETAPHPAKADGEPSSANPRARSALRVAVVLALIIGAAMVLLYLFLYLSSSNSAHQASSVSKKATEPMRTPEKDEVTALRKLAEASDIGSQAVFADRSQNGGGLLRDEKAATALYEQAATKGDSVAQHRLGLALSSGSGGVPADRVAAYAWLVMAQNGGQVIDQTTLDSLNRSLTPGELLDVRYKLGTMYEHGIGRGPDFIAADEWFLLGAAAGDARSRASSAALEARMSPGQISQAHARSDDWLRRHTIKAANNAAR